MINDGYTFQYKEFFYRPLTSIGKGIAESHYDSKNWQGLGGFLWNSPHFIGDETKLTDEDHQFLFTAMMNFNLKEEQERLLEFVKMQLLNPLLAARTCDVCRKYWIDEDTNLISVNGRGPILRPSHAKVSCDTNIGCVKGHYDKPHKDDEISKRTWSHFLEWYSVGLNEESRLCPIVRKNWSIIAPLVNKHGLPDTCIRLLQSAD